ncbi:YhcH/YjgK/YiaL family protein [Ruminococcaceae bacterium OttesenSCG-928-A16]|nr:YhcH/YjgK/YiaL family protein [Ruminococcaceae bacterium OttesenSCG-928-A16]
MFASNIKIAEKYNYLEEKFKIGYAFLRQANLASLPVGVIELEQGVKVQVQEYTTIDPAEGKFETHDKHFDIQYMVSGQEYFGLAAREGLQTAVAYNPENDIEFYQEPELFGVLLLKEGEFVVVAPEDAHKPRLVVGRPAAVKKIVIKVPV